MPSIAPVPRQNAVTGANGWLAQPWFDWLNSMRDGLLGLLTGIVSGAGSPEGVVTAAPGTLYRNTTATAGTGAYVKESAATLDTGWRAL